MALKKVAILETNPVLPKTHCLLRIENPSSSSSSKARANANEPNRQLVLRLGRSQRNIIFTP